MSQTSRIAIIGGSIAGITLARGLLQYPYVDFQVFESKTTCTERGAGVAYAPNAQQALLAMGIDSDHAFKEAGAVTMNSTYARVAFGEHRGELLLKLPGGIQTVARDKWLIELMKPIPADCLLTNKRLISVEKGIAHEPYILIFEDGSTFEADAVIGYDGARSKLREIIIGQDHPENVRALFRGYWDARGKLSPKRAAELFRTELFDPLQPDEVCLIGEGAFMLCAPSDNGDVYHIVISAMAGPNYDKSVWKQDLTREVLEDLYKDWEPHFRTGIIESLIGNDDTPNTVFSQWESPPTHTYYQDRLCIMGDAAHSTTPWLGQGAVMAIEDSSVMAALLGLVHSPQELPAAIRAFDQVRRGRPERVIENSRNAARLLTGQNGLDPSKVEHMNPEAWWTDIWAIDMDAHITDAVDCFNRLRNESVRHLEAAY